tara:strand:+ start:738 stop:1136 length:399 start_codon:yes stop_codon:yes gene_type:complete
MVTLKTLNKAFASLGIELVWGKALGDGYGSERYFYFLISDIDQCPLQFSKHEKFGNGDQLLESFGYGYPLNHMTATEWLEEAIYQLKATYENIDRGDGKLGDWEMTAMRMVLHNKLSKNYEVAETWKNKEVA